jgi:hypothetical protein
MKLLPTICNSSYEIIEQYKLHNFPVDAVIVMADVKELYPSIPIATGLQAIQEIAIQFNYRLEELALILQLLEWVLTHNYLEFLDNIYLQISGTAMGTPTAVSYANIFMYYIEKPTLISYNKSIYLYKRFVDDIFAIVGKKAAIPILDSINNKCTTIKLVFQYNFFCK